MTKPRSILFTMLLLASSILFLTLFLEGVLRLLPIDRTVISQLMTHNKYVDANTSNAISVIDYKPNTSFRHQSTEFDYEIKINSKGLRSREISYEKNKGENSKKKSDYDVKKNPRIQFYS